MVDGFGRYLALSRKYLEDGEVLLAGEDWPQASEKFWGAAEMVKATAESRGWVHDTHRHLFRVISSLAEGGQDGELGRLFGLAHNLHVNFYVDWLPRDHVQDGASAVRELVRRLDTIIDTWE